MDRSESTSLRVPADCLPPMPKDLFSSQGEMEGEPMQLRGDIVSGWHGSDPQYNDERIQRTFTGRHKGRRRRGIFWRQAAS